MIQLKSIRRQLREAARDALCSWEKKSQFSVSITVGSHSVDMLQYQHPSEYSISGSGWDYQWDMR